MADYPQKDFYRLSEVCQYTDTQPYVLRFWESEFPQLNPEKSGSGQPVYRKEDIDLVYRIKELLYEEEFTLDRARKQLESELSGSKKTKRRPRKEAKPSNEAPMVEKKAAAKPVPHTPPLPLDVDPLDTVPRSRYENAIDEIEHLRMKVREAEKGWNRSQSALEEARTAADEQKRRADRAIEKLQELLSLLT